MRLDPKTKSGAGWLLEPPFHAHCVKGTTLHIYPMNLKPGGRTRDTFFNAAYTARQELVLSPQQLVIYNHDHPIKSLKPDHYYQPSHGTQPSFDSFIFVLGPQGPRFIVFQVTDGETHSLKSLGITFLFDLAVQLGLSALEIDFVVVVPEGDQVECYLTKARDFSLNMFCLEVSEGELYRNRSTTM
jgi:hypothetical protein